MDKRRLQNENNKVIQNIIKNNSKENFERKGNERLSEAKQMGKEALEYMEKKKNDNHERMKKSCDEVINYYKPDFAKQNTSGGKTFFFPSLFWEK